jgi:hypothetical protein
VSLLGVDTAIRANFLRGGGCEARANALRVRQLGRRTRKDSLFSRKIGSVEPSTIRLRSRPEPTGPPPSPPLAHDFAQQLLTKAAERLRRGDYYCRRLGVHLSWTGDLGGWWDETDFHETRDTGFLLARLEEIWQRVPRYKPLSVGVVLLDLVPADQHEPDLFAADNGRRQKLSPLIDRINDRYGRCSIGFGLFPSDVRAFKGHAAFAPCAHTRRC